MPRVTIQVLADRLGVSTASVSYALNGQSGVSEATRKRVLELAEELGWRPSSSARALSRSRTDVIGLVVTKNPQLFGTEPYLMRLIEGIEDVLTRAKKSLLLRMVGTEPGLEIEVYRQWSAEQRVDGVFVIDLRVGDPRPLLLHELGLPFTIPGTHSGALTSEDNATDALTIMSHLADLGHHEIFQLLGPLYLDHEMQRQAAVTRHATQMNMRVFFTEGDYTLDVAEHTVEEVFRHDASMSAIITSNDVMAVGAVKALRTLGRRDIGVISWDDTILCSVTTPSISALSRHPEEEGRRAARILLDLIEGKHSSLVAPPESQLIQRETSVPAPVRQPK